MSGNAFDDVDADLLAEIKAIYTTIDPVPQGMTERIKFALTVQALDAEVAELTAGALVAVRSADPSVTDSITFTSSNLSLMISTSVDADDTVRLDGWVTQGGARVAVHIDPAAIDRASTEPTQEVVADAHGRFVLAGLAHGRMMFVVHQHPDRPDEPPVITPVMEI